MIVAVLGTIGYTVLDKFAAEVVQSGPATAARYAYFYFAISFIPYMLLMRTEKEEQGQERPHTWVPGWYRGAAGIRGVLVDPLGIPVESFCQLYCCLPAVKYYHRGDPGICAV